MVDIPMRSAGALGRQNIMSINQKKIQSAKSRNNILDINNQAKQGNMQNSQKNMNSPSSPPVQQQQTIPKIVVPEFFNIVRKGQKAALENSSKLSKIEACLGWNIKNSACDVDVSAFLLSGNKVINDDWFVFYGHPQSPDGSTEFYEGKNPDRECVSIDFGKLNASVEKIVFVLTINEALEKHLNFSMIQDAYIRIFDSYTKTELVSFLMDEYYENVTSMMIGELYKHNGAWKFNAVGNGVARDLAGLCELYGVQVD